MEKIEFKKVTPFSKFLALALFVLMPFVGFWLGTGLGEILATIRTESVSGITGSNMAAPYYENVAEWQPDTRVDGGFSLSYPIDFETNDIHNTAPAMDWRLGANGNPGKIFFALTIPKAFEPQTNFNEAKFTIGSSRNAKALAECLMADQSGGPAQASSTIMIHGVPFAVFSANDAGAGNFYQTTSYRALHGGQCYAIEYTIHSSQIANYPAEYHLREFSATKLTDILDRIVGTFNFL